MALMDSTHFNAFQHQWQRHHRAKILIANRLWRSEAQSTNCGKFIAAFCRFLSLGFEPHFFLNGLVRRWCLVADCPK